jgi:hypothetical protein
MSDSWRRATALPSFYPQQYSPMHVVMPQSYVPASPPRDTSYDEAHARRALHEATMHQYEDARRAYQDIVSREREEIEKAKHEASALSHNITELRMKITNAESRAARAETERDNALARINADTAVLRNENAVMSSELRQLREDNAVLARVKATAAVERMQLEGLVTNLRAELQAMGQTVVDQTSTIRALSTEMSRRDPYHLVKHQREQQQHQAEQPIPAPVKMDTSAIDELQKKLAAMTSERDKAFGDVKKLEVELTTQRAVADKAAAAAQAAFQADIAALNSKLLSMTSEKDLSEKKLAKSEEALGRATLDLKAAQIQIAQLTPAIAAPVKAAPPTKSVETERAEMEADRAKYEKRILELEKDAKSLKESNATLSAESEKLATHLAAVKKQAEKDRAEMKLLAESALGAIALIESGKAATITADKAPLLDVPVCITHCTNLLTRKAGDIPDPYVVLLDPLGREVLRTETITDNVSPQFDAMKNKVTMKVARGSSASLRIEVYSFVPGQSGVFLGSAALASDQLLAEGKRVLVLEPREKENDELILKNAKGLGSVTITIGPSAPTGKSLLAAPVAPPPTAAPLVAPVVAAAAQPSAAQTSAAAATAPVVAPRAPAAPTVPVTAQTVVASKPIPKEPMSFLVHIMGCNGVLDRDTFGGKSDPYVVAYSSVDKKTELVRTPVVDDTSNPSWPQDRASFVVKLDPEADKETALCFEVWDKDDTPSDDFLGFLRVPALDILSQQTGTRQYPLAPREKENDPEIIKLASQLGSITLNFIKLDAKAANPSAPQGVSVVAPTAAEIAEVAKGPAEKILLQVVCCNNLLKRFMYDCDPYVIINDVNGKEVKRTSTVEKTTNPTWKVQDGATSMLLAPSATSTVTFDVWDYDTLGSAQFLGQARVSVNDILVLTKSDGSRVLSLGPREKENDSKIKENIGKLGTITIKATRVEDVQPTLNVATGATIVESAVQTKAEDLKEVTLYVSGGNDLIVRDFRSSDPYVVIYGIDGKELKRTPVCESTLNPKWPEDKASVKVYLSPAYPGWIVLEMWDYNSVMDAKFMGLVKITVPQLFQLNGKTSKLKLMPRDKENDSTILEAKGNLGTVTFTTTISGLPAESSAPTSSEVVSELPSTAPSMIQLGKLQSVRVVVCGCKGLIDRNTFGKCNPYVTVCGPNGKEFKTPAADGTLDPTWPADKASFVYELDMSDPGFVTFDVYDLGKFSSAPLGFARFAVQDIFRGLGKKVFKLHPHDKETDSTLIKSADKLGTVEVDFSLVNGAATAAAPPAVMAAGQPPTAAQPGASAAPPPAVAQPTAAPAATQAVAAPVIPPAAPPADAVLKICINGCDNLINADNTGFLRSLSDPQVEVFGPDNKKVFQTTEIKDNLNPRWPPSEASGSLRVKPGAGQFIRFNVVDVDTVGSDFLGEVKVSVDDALSKPGQPRNYSLGQVEGKDAGTITVTFSN